MASPSESTIATLEKRFEPFVKPREQVNYIRRILALELGSYNSDGSIKQPISLSHSSVHREIGPELRGFHREYIEALRGRELAHGAFEEISQKHQESSTPIPDSKEKSCPLENHLAISRLREKHDSLITIQCYLKRFAEKSATAQSLKDIEHLLKNGNPQPKVPAEVMNSFVVEQISPETDIQSRVWQLEKTVLRANILLKQEEKLLTGAKARCKIKPEHVSKGAKLEALNATRFELINWIETELSKVSTERAPQPCRPAAADETAIAGQVSQVQNKYEAYVAARRELLTLASNTSRPVIHPPTRVSPATAFAKAIRVPVTDCLLIPYVETLLSNTRLQKSFITHKSHFTATLNNQSQESCEVISHLAEESQLLTKYPMKDFTRQHSGVPEIMAAKHSDRPDLASRVKPWIFAADAAKIGTLEAVAEKVEVGQIALENSMKTLHQMEASLGVRDGQGDCASTKVGNTEEDLWLDDGVGKGTEAGKVHKKPPKATSVISQSRTDPWARLHGNLGLIGHDDVL